MDGRFCAYLRKSRADEVREKIEEGYDALYHHRSALEDLASRMQVDIGRWYSDGIKSGEKIEGRDGMRELLSDVQAGRWDGVLVVEVERLTRGDMIDQGTVLRAFLDTSTLIVTPLKVYDPCSEADMEYFEFGLFMSRREFKTINKRLIAGRLASVKEGQYIGMKAPYGYDKAKVDGMKTLVPNGFAKHVVAIYEMYAEGMSYKSIAGSLQAMGVPTMKGGAWNSASVANILKNPVYIGKIRWNYEKQEVYYESGRRRYRTVRNKDMTVVDGLHEPIVSDELWEKARHRSPAAPVRNGLEKRNPFGRILVCKRCGQSLHWGKASHEGGKDRLDHRARYTGDHPCDAKGCTVEDVENEVVKALESIADKLDAMVVPETRGIDFLNAAEECRKAAEMSRKAISDNFDRMERGVISESDFVDRRKVLEARIAESLAEADRLEAMNDDAVSKKAATVRECIRMIGDHSIPVEDRRKAIWAIIDRIEYDNLAPKGTKGNDLRLDIYLR